MSNLKLFQHNFFLNSRRGIPARKRKKNSLIFGGDEVVSIPVRSPKKKSPVKASNGSSVSPSPSSLSSPKKDAEKEKKEAMLKPVCIVFNGFYAHHRYNRHSSKPSKYLNLCIEGRIFIILSYWFNLYSGVCSHSDERRETAGSSRAWQPGPWAKRKYFGGESWKLYNG